MSRLVDGEWHTDAREMTDDDGEFDRQESAFRDAVRDDPDARFPAEPGRYHLYISRACPWAHRAAMVRTLTGLEDAIGLSVVDPIRGENGWRFAPEKADCDPDPHLGADYLREHYLAADPEYTGRVTVPVLWDTERETIVNNESSEIIQQLDVAFDRFASRDVQLFPEDSHEAVTDTIEAIYGPINNGVYKAGFADSQAAHERAVMDLFDALDRWEAVLADQRYLLGERLTAADLCLFATLFRFDAVYHTHFKCNVRRLTDYPNLWGHTRELYQLPGIAETCNMAHVKAHYYRTHTSINPSELVPLGSDADFTAPNDRNRLPGGPPAALGESSADLVE